MTTGLEIADELAGKGFVHVWPVSVVLFSTPPFLAYA
jgi:hypothetical protein